MQPISVTFSPDDMALPRRKLEAICVARIRALETMLGRSAVVHWHAFAAAPTLAPVVPLKPRRATRAKAKLVTMTAEEFFDARMLACRAIAAELGEHWHLVEGASHWCAIPSKLRSFKTARGTTVRCHADARLPVARYWPAGALPDGVVASPDMPRDRTPREVVRRMKAARELEMMERAYKRARDNALYVNRRWNSGLDRYRSWYTPESRADAILGAWELRRELLQARRDAAALGDGAVVATSTRATTRADVMSAEMDCHACRVVLVHNRHQRVGNRVNWRKLVQAAWDARCRLRAARIAYASSATEPVQLPAAA